MATQLDPTIYPAPAYAQSDSNSYLRYTYGNSGTQLYPNDWCIKFYDFAPENHIAPELEFNPMVRTTIMARMRYAMGYRYSANRHRYLLL